MNAYLHNKQPFESVKRGREHIGYNCPVSVQDKMGRDVECRGIVDILVLIFKRQMRDLREVEFSGRAALENVENVLARCLEMRRRVIRT